MIVGPAAERPMIFALGCLDRQVVDAGNSLAHQPSFVELPILIPVTAKPIAAIVMPFIGETYRYPVLAEGPDLLDQTVVELALPFAREKCLDGVAALESLGAVAPEAVDRIGGSDACRIAAVPGVFRQPRLLPGGLGGERRKRRPAHGLNRTVFWRLRQRAGLGKRGLGSGRVRFKPRRRERSR